MVKSTLKKLLPRPMIDQIQVFRENVDIRLAVAASRSNVLSILYYSLYSSEFRREMRAVLLARKRYYQSRSGFNPSSFLLRRNIHRLEKGLIMRPRRPVFGEGYINDSIAYLGRCIDVQCLSTGELSWAQAVIAEYFLAVKSTEIVDRARASFDKITQSLVNEASNKSHAPQAYSDLVPSKVSFDDFKALCQKRHSVRWFEPTPVPREMLDAAIDVAATAPSACNRQPFKFYVFDEPARAQEIGAIPMGTAGFAQNFQAVVVVVGDLSAYPFEKDRHIIYIDSGLAVMQFQLALETQGLASCAINWPDIERHERKMAIELDLQAYERPVMLVAVGYPLAEGGVPYSAKKTAMDLVVRPK